MNESSKLSHLSSDLCSGWRSTNALNLIPFTYLQSSHNQPTWLPTQSYLFSLQVEPAPHLLSPYSSTIRIFVITNHQPLFQICITLPVESAPFFIPSTSFCPLSSWFTSSRAYHLITVISFVLTIYHSLDLSIQTKNSSLSQILSSIVTLIPPVQPSRILT